MGGFNRQMSLLQHTDDTDTLYNALMEIYKKFIKDFPIRNIGINFSSLKVNNFSQLSLFSDPKEQASKHDLEKAIDKLQLKYGKNILLKASALLVESTVIERNSQIGGHRK